jgi:hypothetical protein
METAVATVTGRKPGPDPGQPTPDSRVVPFLVSDWAVAPAAELQRQAELALEDGKVLFFPRLAFPLKADESRFLDPALAGSAKNVSFNLATRKLGKCACPEKDREALIELMQRFAKNARQFIDLLLPEYQLHLRAGRTSLRPVEIAGRKSSWRKDDTRLHVDSFPSTPMRGERILRLFSNVNPNGKPRCWRVGGPFEEVAKRFAPGVSRPFPGANLLMQALRITRGRRSLYDHYMLQLHDRMKADDDYQRNSEQTAFDFPPGTSWMVFTDQAPHAANSGQHQFEQTFYMPADRMVCPNKSPLRILERVTGTRMI